MVIIERVYNNLSKYMLRDKKIIEKYSTPYLITYELVS